MVLETELDALLAALPGNVWSTDAEADHVAVNKDLLRIGGLGSDANIQRRWLDAIDLDDLVGGSLVWTPLSTSSAVSVATFRLKSVGRGQAIRLRALVAPAPQDAGAARRWVGTFFLASAHQTAPEYVAVALLERIAALAGRSGVRPATLAPRPLQTTDERIASAKPLAVLLGCEADDAEQLSALLALLGWRTVTTPYAAPDLVRSTRVTIVGKLSLVPTEVCQPYTDKPYLVALCREENLDDATAARATGCYVLTRPINIIDAEEFIVALP